MDPKPFDPAQRRRGRWMLVGLFALFFGTVFGAGILRFSGWQPAGHKNHGQLLQPPADARDLAPALADGGTSPCPPPGRPCPIGAPPPPGARHAARTLPGVRDKVWQLFGHNADEVDILWIGDYPAQAPRHAALRQVRADDPLRARLPQVDDAAGTPVYVIDPHGFVILRYAPGFDPGHLRTDVAKLIKLI